ncbi:hypothetical protein ABK040_001637 [Willaertia magna]
MGKKGGQNATQLKKKGSSSSSGHLDYNPKEHVLPPNFLTSTSTTITLPTLPTVPYQCDETIYKGPTEYSNWLIPNHILLGGYPRGSKEVKSILSAGTTTFVNLVEEHEMLRCGPFYYASALKKKSTQLLNLNYVTFPIRDKNIEDDKKVMEIINLLIQLVQSGEVLYIHCVGGHGRTGTLASILLGKLFNISADEALAWVQVFHDCRTVTNGRKSPESTLQRNQVYRLLSNK